ncbi:hypothetical protein [Gynuella sp.]|uniref:hypothetical protein n=1 Tax=Gynuella sp. TaxID=2969146 RepID=UPI003D11B312
MKPRNKVSIIGFGVLCLVTSCTGPQFTSLEERFDVVSLNDFAFLTCMSGSYKTGGYPLWSRELDSQAWHIMNDNRTPKYITFKVYQYSQAVGRRIPIRQAPKQCSHWRQSRTLSGLYSDY